jgi:hypothetical protein
MYQNDTVVTIFIVQSRTADTIHDFNWNFHAEFLSISLIFSLVYRSPFLVRHLNIRQGWKYLPNTSLLHLTIWNKPKTVIKSGGTNWLDFDQENQET